MKKVTKKPYNYFYPHIFAIVIGLIFFALCLHNCILTAKDYNTELTANYQEEFATIVYYKAVLHKGYTDYTVCYEYEEDGILYTGNYQSRIKTEKEAIEMLGKKVPIYVDHNLKLLSLQPSVEGSQKGGIWFLAIATFLMFLLCANSIIRIVRYYVKLNKYNKFVLEQNDTFVDEKECIN